MKKILIIEDDTTFSSILSKFLTKQFYNVKVHTTISEGLKALLSNTYDLLILDYRLPDGTGLDLLENESFRRHRIPVIIITTFHEIRIAVQSMKMGASDFITKPVHPEELLMTIQNILIKDQRKKEKPGFSWVKGKSEEAMKMYEYIELVAPTDIGVLIQGENGTGKEFVARHIHRISRRFDKPFVAVDCGALSSELAASELFGHVKGAFTSAVENKIGHFEVAHGGILFLDEIGNLSYENQIKLLRAIQEKTIQPVGSTENKKVNVRLITATNEDLKKQIKNGKFREDLYHRVNEFKVLVPPLRERKSDLKLFIKHFIDDANADLDKKVQGFTERAMSMLENYHWPGNLRELKNIVKRAVLLTPASFADVNTLPEEMLYPINEVKPETSTDLKSIQKNNEKLLISHMLQKVNHNKTKAAKFLNIDRKTLYNKISEYNL